MIDERPATCTISRQGEHYVLAWSAHPRQAFDQITRSFASTLGSLARLQGKQWVVAPEGLPVLRSWVERTFRADCVQADTPALALAPPRPRVLYDAHLRSGAWEDLRRRVLERECTLQARDDPLCAGCWQQPGSQVHHTGYDNLGAEFVFELLLLCTSCHRRLSQ